jgi:hypothetical protein
LFPEEISGGYRLKTGKRARFPERLRWIVIPLGIENGKFAELEYWHKPTRLDRLGLKRHQQSLQSPLVAGNSVAKAETCYHLTVV